MTNRLTPEQKRFSFVVYRDFCLIIPTIKQREQELYELLRYLLNLAEMPKKIIIVSDDTSGSISKIQKEYERCGVELKFVKVTEGLTAGAHRNVGIKISNEYFLLFLDDDVLPDKRWLTEVKNCLQVRSDMVGGPSRPLFIKKTRPPIWWDQVLLGPYVAVGNEYIKSKTSAIWSCNLAVKKSIIENIGYFDETLGPRKYARKTHMEDTEFVRRAVRHGLKVVFNPRAVVYHKLDHNRLIWKAYKKWAKDEGYSHRIFYQKTETNATVAFIRHMIFQIFRLFYSLLMRKSNPIATFPYMLLLLFQIEGYLGK